jgi:hypothetical protein
MVNINKDQKDFDQFLRSAKEQAQAVSNEITSNVRELLSMEVYDNGHIGSGKECNRERGEQDDRRRRI